MLKPTIASLTHSYILTNHEVGDDSIKYERKETHGDHVGKHFSNEESRDTIISADILVTK